MTVLMKTKGIVVVLGVLSLLVSGCYYGRGLTYAEGGTLMGALYGAGLGAAIGSATGHAGEGAGIGALAGSLIGGAIGYGMEGPYRYGYSEPRHDPYYEIPTTAVITTLTPGTRIIGGTAAPRPLTIRTIGRTPRTIRAVTIRYPMRTIRTTRRIPALRYIPRSTTRNRIGE